MIMSWNGTRIEKDEIATGEKTKPKQHGRLGKGKNQKKKNTEANGKIKTLFGLGLLQVTRKPYQIGSEGAGPNQNQGSEKFCLFIFL
jgi:hypothetical protein